MKVKMSLKKQLDDYLDFDQNISQLRGSLRNKILYQN